MPFSKHQNSEEERPTKSSNQFLQIDKVSTSLRFAARAWLKRFNINPDHAEDFLADATLKVVESDISLESIRSPRAYVFRTFKNIALQYVKTVQEEQIPVTEEGEYLEFYNPSISNNFVQEIENNILIENIMELVDERTRFILDQFILGNNFEEITELYNKEYQLDIKSNHLRSMYSKSLKKIQKELELVGYKTK